MSGQYQGWSNYPTWNVALWIGNDEYLDDEAVRLARMAVDVNELSDGLKDTLEEIPEVEQIQSGAGFVSDIFGWAWAQIDWLEIAEHYWADYHEEDSEDEDEEDEDAMSSIR